MTIQRPNNLLREKVVSHKILGPPSISVVALRDYFRLQLTLWAVLLLAATYLLTKTHYKETVAARGVLEPVSGIQEIVSPAAARVKEIHVQQGARVEKGDLLATLDSGVHNAQGGSSREESIGQLVADRALLKRQLEIQQSARQQSRRWNSLAAENIYNAKLSIEQEAELLAARKALSERSLRAVSLLLKSGNSSAREYDLQYQAYLDLLSREQALTQKLLQYEHEQNSLSNSQQLAELDSEQMSLQIEREMQELDQRITSLENQAVFTVVAERAGIIAELGLEQGNSVRPNQPLFFIQPASSELHAMLYVPAAVQAKLSLGQTVLLRYDAFDYRLHGRYEGVIASIGQARLDPRETMLPIPAIKEPVFKVTASLSQSSVQGDASYELHSGATLTADFVLSEMSLLQFIFKPLLSLQGKVA